MSKHTTGFLVALCVLLTLSLRARAQSDEAVRKDYLEELIRLQKHPASSDAFVTYHGATWMKRLDRRRRAGAGEV